MIRLLSLALSEIDSLFSPFSHGAALLERDVK